MIFQANCKIEVNFQALSCNSFPRKFAHFNSIFMELLQGTHYKITEKENYNQLFVDNLI